MVSEIVFCKSIKIKGLDSSCSISALVRWISTELNILTIIFYNKKTVKYWWGVAIPKIKHVKPTIITNRERSLLLNPRFRTRLTDARWTPRRNSELRTTEWVTSGVPSQSRMFVSKSKATMISRGGLPKHQQHPNCYWKRRDPLCEPTHRAMPALSLSLQTPTITQRTTTPERTILASLL